MHQNMILSDLRDNTSSTTHANPKSSQVRFGEPRRRSPLSRLRARSRFGSYIINVIHYQNAVSLPTGEGISIHQNYPIEEIFYEV